MSMVTAQGLLEVLPPYRDEWAIVEERQNVYDIIKGMLDSHREFAGYYDLIALYFDGPTTEDICENIYRFLVDNVKYREEKEAAQTTALPTGILMRGCGDCKHYSQLAGGILDAINRLTGKNIKWSYRFASYDPLTRTPHHVFVVVFEPDGSEIWIDPTPGASDKEPVWQLDKKVNVSSMALYQNIAGVGKAGYNSGPVYVDSFPEYPNEVLSPAAVTELEEMQAEQEISAELQSAIEVLMHYNVLNEKGEVSDKVLADLSFSLPLDDFATVSHARQILQVYIDRGASIGNIFSDIWRGIKKVQLAIPRNAYLSLVALNVFGYATSLWNAIYKADGSYFQPNQDTLYKKWHSLGGDWKNLENAIKSGHTKKAILGGVQGNSVGVAPAAAPAWLAEASAIIVAIAAIMKDMLAKKTAAGQMAPGIDPATGLPYGLNSTGTSAGGSSGIMSWVQQNPVESIAIGAGIYFAFFNKKKRHGGL